jgi:hypothetical protein
LLWQGIFSPPDYAFSFRNPYVWKPSEIMYERRKILGKMTLLTAKLKIFAASQLNTTFKD